MWVPVSELERSPGRKEWQPTQDLCLGTEWDKGGAHVATVCGVGKEPDRTEQLTQEVMTVTHSAYRGHVILELPPLETSLIIPKGPSC